MKKIIILSFLISCFMFDITFSQTIDGQFITNINNPTYSVTIALDMAFGSGTGSAGVLQIEFTFNGGPSGDLSFSASPTEGTDYVLHGGFASYNTKNIQRLEVDRIRINLVTTGTPVSIPEGSPTNVITLNLNITDVNGNSSLQFDLNNTFVAPALLSAPYLEGSWPSKNDAPLPVELTSFTASNNQNAINLKWQTKTEVDNYGFEIERAVADLKSSVRNPKFEKIGFVSGYGNSNSPKEYSFVDKNPSGGGRFVYRLKQVDTDGKYQYSDEVSVDFVPQKFQLFQNYPNPFNPSTTIKFAVPKAGNITLAVYSLLGEKIKDLYTGFKEPGIYNFEFDGKELGSGTYIYRLQAEDFVQVRKMLLIK